MFDVDRYKLSLGNIQWTTSKIKDFSTIYIKKLKGAKTINENPDIKDYLNRGIINVSALAREIMANTQINDFITLLLYRAGINILHIISFYSDTIIILSRCPLEMLSMVDILSVTSLRIFVSFFGK